MKTIRWIRHDGGDRVERAILKPRLRRGVLHARTDMVFQGTVIESVKEVMNGSLETMKNGGDHVVHLRKMNSVTLHRQHIHGGIPHEACNTGFLVRQRAEKSLVLTKRIEGRGTTLNQKRMIALPVQPEKKGIRDGKGGERENALKI